jgi:hypothetical protein
LTGNVLFPFDLYAGSFDDADNRSGDFGPIRRPESV